MGLKAGGAPKVLERAGLLAFMFTLVRFAFGGAGRGSTGAGGVYSGAATAAAAARKGLRRSLGCAHVLVSMDELLPCADVSSRPCCGADAGMALVVVVVLVGMAPVVARAGAEEEAGASAGVGAA